MKIGNLEHTRLNEGNMYQFLKSVPLKINLGCKENSTYLSKNGTSLLVCLVLQKIAIHEMG